mmetsp:Transcript_4296/g.11838  ORF Transcript_4296/g.11838 Transcript_4296/m.11838 type:complete len:250 (-) Transcript_4296:27-776(-)
MRRLAAAGVRVLKRRRKLGMLAAAVAAAASRAGALEEPLSLPDELLLRGGRGAADHACALLKGSRSRSIVSLTASPISMLELLGRCTRRLRMHSSARAAASSLLASVRSCWSLPSSLSTDACLSSSLACNLARSSSSRLTSSCWESSFSSSFAARCSAVVCAWRAVEASRSASSAFFDCSASERSKSLNFSCSDCAKYVTESSAFWSRERSPAKVCAISSVISIFPCAAKKLIRAMRRTRKRQAHTNKR